MTHEEYVSLETAKLLKQAGFDWECNHRYSEGHETNNSTPTYFSPRDNWNQDEDLYSAPTQAVAQRWLREKHSLYIIIDKPNISGWRTWIENDVDIFPEMEDAKIMDIVKNSAATYESALEAGLQECIKLILEKKEMKILDLSLTYKMYDKIARGEKKEEYREIKPFYMKRFWEKYDKGCPAFIGSFTKYCPMKYRNYDAVRFHRGQGGKQTITVEFQDISVGFGVSELGAPLGEEVFIIKLGNILAM